MGIKYKFTLNNVEDEITVDTCLLRRVMGMP